MLLTFHTLCIAAALVAGESFRCCRMVIFKSNDSVRVCLSKVANANGVYTVKD